MQIPNRQTTLLGPYVADLMQEMGHALCSDIQNGAGVFACEIVRTAEEAAIPMSPGVPWTALAIAVFMSERPLEDIQNRFPSAIEPLSPAMTVRVLTTHIPADLTEEERLKAIEPAFARFMVALESLARDEVHPEFTSSRRVINAVKRITKEFSRVPAAQPINITDRMRRLKKISDIAKLAYAL